MVDDPISAALAALRSDVSELRSDVGSVRDRVTRVETRWEAISAILLDSKKRFDQIDEKLDYLASHVAQGIGWRKAGSYITYALIGLSSAIATLFIGGMKH